MGWAGAVGCGPAQSYKARQEDASFASCPTTPQRAVKQTESTGIPSKGPTQPRTAIGGVTPAAAAAFLESLKRSAFVVRASLLKPSLGFGLCFGLGELRLNTGHHTTARAVLLSTPATQALTWTLLQNLVIQELLSHTARYETSQQRNNECHHTGGMSRMLPSPGPWSAGVREWTLRGLENN